MPVKFSLSNISLWIKKMYILLVTWFSARKYATDLLIAEAEHPFTAFLTGSTRICLKPQTAARLAQLGEYRSAEH